MQPRLTFRAFGRPCLAQAATRNVSKVQQFHRLASASCRIALRGLQSLGQALREGALPPVLVAFGDCHCLLEDVVYIGLQHRKVV